MKKARNFVLCMTAVLSLSAMLFIRSCENHDQRQAESFDSITTGLPKENVLALLGPPKSVIGCDDPEFPSPKGLLFCKVGLVYGSEAGSIIPSYEVTWLDAQDLVVGKYTFTSP